jgi:hypothetical protein
MLAKYLLCHHSLKQSAGSLEEVLFTGSHSNKPLGKRTQSFGKKSGLFLSSHR